MPTSLSGLLLFVVLLLPGFVYTVSRERFGVERKLTALRETASVVAISVFTELSVLIATWPFWSWVLDVDRLIKEPQKYFEARPGLLTMWFLGLLLLATVVAFALALPKLRARRPLRWVAGPFPHPSTSSAWWTLFEDYPNRKIPPQASHIYVGCTLEDGSYIDGLLSSFNSLSEDAPDRDLILLAPIRHRGATSDETKTHSASAVCISARRIVTMFVTYPPPSPSATCPAPAAEAEASVP
ncbi:DUF6338 family protein [Nonomuraea sp. NPDC002799]